MKLHRRLPKLTPTHPEIFLDRRKFVTDLGLKAAGCALAAPLLSGTIQTALAQQPTTIPGKIPDFLIPPFQRPDVFPAKPNTEYDLKDLAITERMVTAMHNNYYEFLPGKGGQVHQFVEELIVKPWEVEVSGLCENPTTFDLDDLFKFEHEERVYHFRCVETWSMNVPWTGFPLKKLLDKVVLKPNAKYITFITANRPHQMPGMRAADYYRWPYQEALRVDEALNELTMLATGLYDEPLLKQHGAPIRLVVPWKYGYKNPKSIAKIKITSRKPSTFWNLSNPDEYGFLSNVNPNVPHPRWSQATEYDLNDRLNKRPTTIYNGYQQFVNQLYPDEPKTPLEKAPKKPR